MISTSSRAIASTVRQATIVLALIALALTIGHFLGIDTAQAALIQPTDNPSNISEATGGATSARSLVLTMVNWVLAFLGLVAVIMVIFGGFLYVTAAGKEDQAGKGKKVIMYAIVGIAIILLSFAIINTVLAGLGTGNESAT